ncbi:Ca2+/Na+ antiporter [Anaerosolibacter carboniphilus]|uniref:Ca2+/Na+ antiporter n=1 Tax=Anaerosolibacter carboniphilus TaxID=1417629 RepID=A0A841L6X9_9FIRM|nr:hypothetical protein [Anaerosolibacter carboniphilus]MBB6218149.1 Ca2+/Na+ antiporter [Anaerosolibacter carboniphilus]
MDYVQYVLNILIVLFVYIVIVKIYMEVANYVGERLGIGQFVIGLCKKMRRDK